MVEKFATKSSGIFYVLERTPFVSFMYFTFFDDTPSEADVSSILNTIALVSALLLTIACGAVGVVPKEDLVRGAIRYAPGGEYGCLRTNGNLSIFDSASLMTQDPSRPGI